MAYQPKTGMRFRKEIAELFNNPIVPGSLTVPLLLDDLAACEAALAEEQQRHQWRDIETAPKEDEQDILLGYWWRNPFAHDTAQPIFKQCVGRWTDFNGGGWITANGGNVTHWQPLPQPPRKDGAK